MRRRSLLTVVGSSLVAVSGCTSDDGATGTTEDRPAATGTETPTATEPADTARPTATPTSADTETPTERDDGTETAEETADGEVQVDVSIREVEYVASTYQPSEGRGIDPDDVVPESEIPPALRDALREAVGGEFETDSPPDALLSAVDEFRVYDSGSLRPYVELDGTNYEFDHTLPTFTAELGGEDVEEYDEDRVFHEEDAHDLDSEAVESFVAALAARGTHVPRSEYRRCVRPEAVDEFLDDYDYVRDYKGVGRIRTTVENDDPPHTITAWELTEGDMWGRPVVEASELDAAVVDFFERAIASDHRQPALVSDERSFYFTDHVPQAYFDFVDEHSGLPYVRLDGTVYSVSAGRVSYDGTPVSVTAEGVAGDEPAFELSVTPAPEKAEGEIEGPYTFTSDGALPSVLWVTHRGERHLLDSPGYDRSRWREAPDDPERDRRPSNQVLETIGADEELSATYVVPDDIPDGTHVSRGLFNVSWSVPDQTPGEYAGYPFELAVSVDRETDGTPTE